MNHKIMKKNIILMLVSLALATSLSAQITREKADEIVFEHLQKEVTTPYLLYVYSHAPSEDEIVITTYNEENIKVKYACWAYYLNENPELSEPRQHRYLLVKENDGNLLEIITANDFGVENLTGWSLLSISEVNALKIKIYPNPTSGELRVMSDELRVTSVEVFDIYGRKQKAESRKQNEINISNLAAGLYFVRITTEMGEIIRKITKH